MRFRFDFDAHSARRQQAISLVPEAVGPVRFDGFARPAEHDLARKQQDRRLLVRLLDHVCIARLQHKQPDVHQHPVIVDLRVDIRVIAALRLFFEIHGSLLTVRCAL